MKTYENYITTNKLNLDLAEIKNSCYSMKDVIMNNFKNVTEDGYNDAGGTAPITTQVHEQYNLLMYRFKGFHSLYFEIQKLFQQINKNEDTYYINCWLNIYQKGHFLDWHEHYPKRANAFHGFYCIDCEPSKTTYKIPNVPEPVDVINENNLLVISPSTGDWHRTWPWEFGDRDRITIAFDIVPAEWTDDARVNWWIPI
jgi:hypothetical protein